MSDCCSTSHEKQTLIGKHPCPACGNACTEVSSRTILHHINKPWEWKAQAKVYFFCDAPECDVVYFGNDDYVIKKSALRTDVGIKEKNQDATICYCFGVTRSAAMNDPTIRTFVIQQTRDGICSCDTSNPSGRCCLKDFPPAVQ